MFLVLAPKNEKSNIEIVRRKYRMPKMKTHRGSCEAFQKNWIRKLKRSHAYRSHLFANKSTKAKRHLT